MAIQIFNGVTNINGTPGVVTNTLANRPTATVYAEGTLYFCSDTSDIFQVINGNWKACGGGTGITPDWQSTLVVSSVLSQNNIIDCNNYTFKFDNVSNFTIAGNVLSVGSATTEYFNVNSSSGSVTIGNSVTENNLQLTKVSGDYVLSAYTAGGDQNYITINPGTQDYYFGDYLGTGFQSYIWIDDTHKNIEIHSNTFQLRETDAGQGEIDLVGSGYTSTTAGANVSEHLIIYINGVMRKIQLKAP